MSVQSLGLHSGRRPRSLVASQLRLRGFAPLVVGFAVTMAIFIRGRMVWAPEGDSALHLKIIEDIAHTHRLPTVLPYFPARIAPGGNIEAMFPYQYTPLFHVIGAIFYSVAGTPGVTLMNALAGGIIAVIMYRMLSRRIPAAVALASAVVAFVPPTTLLIFSNVYMEPLMLAAVFGAAWCFYVALVSRRKRAAIAAGALIGVAIGIRQVAVIYAFAGVLVGIIYLLERGAWRWSRLRRELPWMAWMTAALIITAAPSLAYAVYVNGTLGYGDLSVPGIAPRLAVDPVANNYLTAITKPDVGIAAWINSYRVTLTYSERWLPRWYAVLPLFAFIPGLAFLEARGGAPRMFARLTIVQVVLELALYATTHGNSRYVIASRMMFYAVLPVGLYAIYRAVPPLRREHINGGQTVTRQVQLVAVGALAIAIGASMIGRGYLDFLTSHDDLISARSSAYGQAGAWIQHNTAPDSLILVPRVYTAELTFERNVTWVTFYGNAWVVDAISQPDPRIAHDILEQHGVDYVLIEDPPGTYVDRMPPGGMRSFLQLGMPQTPYFTLAYQSQADALTISGARIYRVEPDPEARAQ